jgi:hypothetical protein
MVAAGQSLAINVSLLRGGIRGKVAAEPYQRGNTDALVTDVSYVAPENMLYVWIRLPRAVPPALLVAFSDDAKMLGAHTFATASTIGTADGSNQELSFYFEVRDVVIRAPPTMYSIALRACEGPCGEEGTAYSVAFPSGTR